MAEKAELAIHIKARDEATAQLKGIQGTIQGVSKQLRAVGIGMIAAGGAITATLGMSIKEFAQTGDEIQKMALRTGFSTEAVSELKHALEICGADARLLDEGVKKMTKSIVDASEGSAEYVDALARIGLSAEELLQLKPEDQFMTIATAIAALEDQTIKAATAQELFGKSGMEMLPLLAEGKEGIAALRQEAHDLGIVFDQDAADKAANFNDSLHRCEEALNSVKMVLAENLVPALTDFAGKVSDIIGKVRAWMEEHPALTEWLTKGAFVLGLLLIPLGTLLIMLPSLAGGISLVAGAFGGLNLAIAPYLVIAAAVVAAGILIWKNWDTICEWAGKVKEAFEWLWATIKEKLLVAFEWLKEHLLWFIAPPFGYLLSLATGTGNVVEAFQKLRDMIMGALKKALDWLSEKFNSLIKPFKDAYNWVNNLIHGSGLEELALAYQTAGDAADEFGRSLGGQIDTIRGTERAVDGLASSLNSYASAAERQRQATIAGAAEELKAKQAAGAEITSEDVVQALVKSGLITATSAQYWLQDIGAGTAESKALYAQMQDYLGKISEMLGITVYRGEVKQASAQVAREVAQAVTGVKIKEGYPYPTEIKQFLQKWYSFQGGGTVPFTGLHYLHKGETVLPERASMQAPLVISLDGRKIAECVVKVISNKLALQNIM